jgi:catechol 2,3-dioxygenase-like lactoylglutathione lyase family enzyme
MQLDAIGIVVADMKAAVRFYRLLGLDFAEATEDHLEAQTASGVRVMLDAEALVKSFVHDWVEPRGQRVGLAFRCETPADVDRTYTRILEAGFRGAKEPWDAFWGQRYAQVYDPDGNRVDLFAPLPG